MTTPWLTIAIVAVTFALGHLLSRRKDDDLSATRKWPKPKTWRAHRGGTHARARTARWG